MFFLSKKKFLLFIFILLIGLTTIFSSPLNVFAQPNSEDIIIEIEGGYNGIAKLGAWSPVKVKISSVNRSVSGEVEVEFNLDQSRRAILSKPVELMPGLEQEIYFEIPVVTAKKGFDIRLVDSKKTLAQETFSFKRLLPPEVMLIGVLSEDSEAFNWMNGNTVPIAQDGDYDEKMKLMIAAGEIHPSSVITSTTNAQDIFFKKHEAVVIPLNRDIFPDKDEVISGFDLFIISKYDTSLLNDNQITALEKWVTTGGTLITGTGLSWQKVYHGLPDNLKPYVINRTEDVQCTEILKMFTGRETPDMNLKLAKGQLGFDSVTKYGFEDSIVVGDEHNPLAINYQRDYGTVIVLTFEPTVEPFASWQSKTTFMESLLQLTNINYQRFYEYSNGYYRSYSEQSSNISYLATEVPYDKAPPFLLMFIFLGVYVVLVGPVLYITLKVMDKRDLAWVIIPALSLAFLIGMYLFGFKTRYNAAITNTASIIEIKPELKEARVSSAIGVFNNKRGTMTIEYNEGKGIQIPFFDRDNYYYGGAETQANVVLKYTQSNPVIFEKYDVQLWMPNMLYAQQTIPVSGDILNDITIEDGKLKGTIENTTAFDLLDTVIVLGNNIIRIGDVVSGDKKVLDIPFDSSDVYKRPDEYLEAMYGRTYYDTPQEYPKDYAVLNQRRRTFEDYLNRIYRENSNRSDFTMLARNEQEIDYDLIVNKSKPQKYSSNLISLESEFTFAKGHQVEIPGGIILPSMYQEREIAWYQGDYGIAIQNTGDIQFEFILPSNLSVTEMKLSVANYIPLYQKYRMSHDSSNIEILTNIYAYYLYNFKTQNWDEIHSEITEGGNMNSLIKGNVSQYIGNGNEVLMMVSVLKLGSPDIEEGVYKDYYNEIIATPEIYLKGVSK